MPFNNQPLKYLVVEDIEDVSTRLVHEMQAYPQWQLAGTAKSVREARQLLTEHKPQLLFCDWDLVGGSGFEVLQYAGSIAGYQPFVVFNTAFQSDHPEIAEEMVNTYRPDVFINKPYWQKVREQLSEIVQKAACKHKENASSAAIWIKTITGEHRRIEAENIFAIIQCSQNPRNKLIYLTGYSHPIASAITWQQAAQMMEHGGQEVFPVNRRFALVSKMHIQRYQPPYLWVGKPQLKLEVVKENVKDFERWLSL
ncbi:MAG TPA: hypothetical protein PKD90_04385 [Phnomibacter sp.]|nr:hypothetical protein [Phnomibacter sp.]